MLRSPTTIVVGAGASAEYGLPLGSDLRNSISELVDIRFSEFGSELEYGDDEIVECLRATSRETGGQGNINRFLPAARNMAAAMPLALSIDNYLEAHQDNDDAILCGKLAIARAILNAEESSSLNFDHRNEDTFDLSAVQNTWIARLVNALTEGVSRSRVDMIFENLTIVSFNYDRCIKHFLKDALKAYYSLEDSHAVTLLQSLKIYHPYGSVGKLPWEEHNGIRFGRGRLGERLTQVASNIKTFTEQIEEHDIVQSIRKSVSQSRHLIFLGFGFHRQNLDLLAPGHPGSCQSAFCTTLKISDPDKEVIKGLMNARFKRDYHDLIVYNHDGTCSSLFDQYWRSITS